MKARYKISIGIATVLLMAGLAFLFLPWKTQLGHILQSALASRGLPDVDFTLSDIHPGGATFQGVTVGKDRALTMDRLDIRYSRKADNVSAEATDMTLDMGDLRATAMKGALQTQNGTGEWNIHGLRAQAGATILPLLTGSGKLTLGSAALSLSGALKSKDEAYHADFSMDYPSAHPEEALLKLVSVRMPWKGGVLTTKNVAIPLAGTQPIKMVLQIRRVSTDALLQAMTGKRVTATGTVSGNLPLIIEREGIVSFGAGTLKADGAGRISMPADAIPESGEQVGVVRDVLKNFHYQGMSIDIRHDEGRGILLLIALEGNNPDMYNGRPVKLNVRLAGDVLGYIRQNVLLLTSPETFLKQDRK